MSGAGLATCQKYCWQDRRICRCGAGRFLGFMLLTFNVSISKKEYFGR
jgi:hypothetical protein